MNYQVRIITDITTEPVTVDEAKAFMRIDADYAGDDVNIELLITSARERLEKHLNLGFGVKSLETQFTGGCIELPYGPTGNVTSVLPVKTPASIIQEDYTLHGLEFKTLIIGKQGETSFFYPINAGMAELWSHKPNCGTYNVLYTSGYVTLPKALKHALLVQIDYMYKGLGNPDLLPLSPVSIQLSSVYSRNLIIQ